MERRNPNRIIDDPKKIRSEIYITNKYWLSISVINLHIGRVT